MNNEVSAGADRLEFFYTALVSQSRTRGPCFLFDRFRAIMLPSQFGGVLTLKGKCIRFGLFLVLELCLTVFYRSSMVYLNDGGSMVFSYFVNLLTLACCVILLEKDFSIRVFEARGMPLLKSILCGSALGLLFAVAVILVLAFTSVVNLLPLFYMPLSAKFVVNSIIFQFLVALAEEACFRYYLFEGAVACGLPRWLAAVLISFLFAFGHFYVGGIGKQFGAALAFSLVMFLVKWKGRASFPVLAAAHFVYDLCALFVFSA